MFDCCGYKHDEGRRGNRLCDHSESGQVAAPSPLPFFPWVGGPEKLAKMAVSRGSKRM